MRDTWHVMTYLVSEETVGLMGWCRLELGGLGMNAMTISLADLKVCALVAWLLTCRILLLLYLLWLFYVCQLY